ncbi:helix-turn-helix domain-containing protein [Kitasatospora sp. NPDC048545]|uniref:helix-turn-helix domain-containing protein n=1 Tax=Kitasatospora sp. NPDC048545 TaxID=3157208 RepID=UPI0034027877
MARAAGSPKRYDAEGNVVPTTNFGYAGSYSTVDNSRMNGIAEAVETITDREARVLIWWLANTPGPDMHVELTITEIAARLKMDPKALSRNVAKLNKLRLLLHVKTIGRNRFFRVTPYLTHQGSAFEQRTAIRDWNPPEIPAYVPPQKDKPKRTRKAAAGEEE